MVRRAQATHVRSLLLKKERTGMKSLARVQMVGKAKEK